MQSSYVVAIYCPEDDVHFPTLSVRETLDPAPPTGQPILDSRVSYPTQQMRWLLISKPLPQSIIYGLVLQSLRQQA